MRLLISEKVPNYSGGYNDDIKKLKQKIPSINLNIIETPVDSNNKSLTLEFDEVEGTNCVALFGMWYDLDSQTFSLSRSDTVVGIKMFTIGDLYFQMGLRVPANVNDLILEYKATGKLAILFPDESTGPATFLQYFLSENSKGSQKVDKSKFLKDLIWDIAGFGSTIRNKAAAKRNSPNSTRQARNIMGTAPIVYLNDREKFSENDIYASSCKSGVIGSSPMSEIKALQAFEILEAESLRASDGYLDPVQLDIDKVPTFQRITGREKSSIKTSINRFPDNKLAHIDEKVREIIDISEFKRFMVEMSKCASKALEVK